MGGSELFSLHIPFIHPVVIRNPLESVFVVKYSQRELRKQFSCFVMLLEAIHVELWFAYAVVVNVHVILIKLVNVLFQYLIPNKSLRQTL